MWGLSLRLRWMKTAADCLRWLTKLMLRAVKEFVNGSTILCFISEYIWFVTVALLSREKGVCAHQELCPFPPNLVTPLAGLRAVGLRTCSAVFLSCCESGLHWPRGGAEVVSVYQLFVSRWKLWVPLSSWSLGCGFFKTGIQSGLRLTK